MKSSQIVEKMSTILKEIETMMNLRPLTFVSDVPDEPRPLTPFHFLLGRETTGTIVQTLNGLTPFVRNDLIRMMKYKEILAKTVEGLPRAFNVTQKWSNRNDSIKLGDTVPRSEDNLEIN